MQISVKTPPDLTCRVLEKCALLGYPYPSTLAGECVWQCLMRMDNPHGPFRPLAVVEKYFHALGREAELRCGTNKDRTNLIKRLEKEDRAKRTEEAGKRLAAFKEQMTSQSAPKHLHLKISAGETEITTSLQAKAEWLRMKPNTFVVACLRDCLGAMDDPHKALLPPPIVADYWTLSKAHLRPQPKDTIGVLVQNSQERMIRERTGPIMDTLIRCALKEEWEIPLKQILIDAGVFSEDPKARN